MKKIIPIILIVLSSCSSSVSVITVKEEYGYHITSKNLQEFSNPAKATVKQVKSKEVSSEFEYMKKYLITGKDHLIPNGIFTYAIVKGSDTIYASSNLTYWFYKEKVILYQSPIINVETINDLQ
ncbi:hypothetical protein V1389_17680 [Flavobacterium rakeshii]|uniref:hypothetical protein n=1 Tax=Flavobacterium rakeshii TaxID=1038845 RepID=UPI002E7B9F9F|nr:hypothetical protein [Flavobacterium rakeshii]MEE1900180.1 hypothetical protein [Flavobacterium rakeshii]